MSLRGVIGSICKGSLTVGIFEAVWSVVRRLKCRNALYNCFLALYQRNNRHGFAYMIVKPVRFSVAANEAWNAFAERGIQAVLFDDVLHSFMTIPVVAFSCLVGSMFTWFNSSLLTGTIAFWIAFASVNLSCEVVIAGLCSLYCGFAEDPGRLYDKNPVMFHRLTRISEFGFLDDQRHSWRSNSEDSFEMDVRFTL